MYSGKMLKRGRPSFVTPESFEMIEKVRTRARSERRKFIENFLWIKNTKRQMQRLVFNHSQELMWSVLEESLNDPSRATRAIERAVFLIHWGESRQASAHSDSGIRAFTMPMVDCLRQWMPEVIERASVTTQQAGKPFRWTHSAVAPAMRTTMQANKRSGLTHAAFGLALLLAP